MKKHKKTVLSAILLLILTISLCMFTACNTSPRVLEGTITDMVYGTPVVEERGKFQFTVAGDPDYFVKAENEKGEYQWFRADYFVYKKLKIGDHFVFDEAKYSPVNCFLDRT